MDVLHLFVEEGLWIIWDGLVCKSQENQSEGTDWFGTENPHSLKCIGTNPIRIIHHCFQAQWIATKKYESSNSHKTRLQLMGKKAQLEQLLLSLRTPVKHEFVEEYHILLDKISSVIATDSNQKFTLSTENLQFLSESMLRNPLVALSIVMNLFSPCLPHLTESDADLTRLCGNALNKAIHRLDKESSGFHKGVLLKLLSTVIENSDCLPRIHELTLTNSVSESEVHLALIARGGSPPCLLQNFCHLENPNTISENGVFNTRNAFLLQSHTKQHWCLDLLSSCYEEVTAEKSVDVKIVMSQPYTSILSPLLLLMAWDQQCCDENVIALLTETSKKVDSDPIFERLGYLLERRATIVKWVQLHDKNCSQSVKCNVLEKLQKFSTLKVLHETDCLTNSDKQAVENLLLKAKSNSVEDWEVTLFQGFCVITSVLQLISASLSEGSGNSNKENGNQLVFNVCDDFESMLKTELAKIRSLLETLNPLQFRLEVLENVFSLIFLRYENLCMEDAPSDSGGEEDEDQTDTSLAEHDDHCTVERDGTIHSKVIPKQCSKQKHIKTDSRGFVCSPIVIQEILNCLSECLVDCSASFFKLRTSTVELNPSDANLEKQINMLMQVTAEALWRLKLLLDLPFAHHTKHSFIPEPQRGYPSTASSSDSDEPSEERRKLERTQRRMSHTSRNGRTECTDRSSESSSNTTGSMTSSGGRRPSHRRARAQNRLPEESDSIVRLLLANPASLVTLCLSRGDVSKAQQVIQIFQVSTTSLKNEANFLAVYENLAAEMALEKHLNSKTSQSQNLNSSLTMFSTLKAIQQAASTGVSAAGISSCIEKVLTSAPRVHSLDRITSEYRRASCILSGLNAQVMAACDAALTLGGTREASLSLLDVVSQHWVSSSQELKQDGGRNKGFPVFMSNLMDLYRSLEKFSSEDSDDGLGNFVTTWENPLSISLIKEYSCVWSGIREALEKFVEESDKSNCKCQVTSVRKIIKSCRESFSYYESRGVVSTTENLQTTYLQNLLWYLQTLSSLVTKCSHETEGDCNPFVVLSEGWCELLGRLVFELDAPLSHVERVTTRLQLDLLCAVVVACCPSIQLSQLAAPAVSTQLPTETAWAKISLNAGSAKHSESNKMSANSLASTLLSQLVSALKSCSTSSILIQEDFTHASQNPAVLNILNDTSKLINVDLESLTSNLERVSFLCNITNLLFLHGLVVLGPHWGLVSSHHAEKKSAFHCVGYHVGQMGFVSISGLLSQLVGSEEQIQTMHESREQYWTIGDKRAYFCLTQGTIQSPVIQVVDHDKAEIQLSSAITSFINRSVRVEGSTSEGCFALLIPRMVLVFLGISSPSSLEHAQEARDEPVALQQTMFPQVTYLARDCMSHIPQVLEFLQHYATDQLQFQLAEWAEAWKSSEADSTDLIVTVEEASMKFGVVLSSTIEIVNSESMQTSLVSFENSSLDITWETRTLSTSVGKYLEHQCWLVALLATRLRQDTMDFHVMPQTACLDRLSINHMSALAVLVGGNVTMAALQPWQILSQTLWTVLDKFLFEQQDMECAKLILSLPECSMASDVKLQTFRDIVLYQVASQGPAQSIDKPWCLALCLGTAELRAKCVLNAIKYWPGPESIDILKAMLGETSLTPSIRTQIINMLHRVTIYQNVHQVLCYYQTTKPSSWYEVCKLSEESPGQVLQSLIKAKQYRLCLPWAELHGIPHRAQHLVNASFVSLLLEIESSDFSSAEKLLSSIPVPQAVAICRRLLGSLTLLPSLRFVVSFALEKCRTWLQENPTLWSRLQLWSVGLSILALLPISEQCRDRMLASQPHLLLEQLLMNSRLAILDSALKILRAADLSALPADSPTQPIAVDTMLRQYATKALDFRVSNRAVLPEAPCATQDELLQSLTTGSTGSGHVPFVMPAIAPTKQQWIPNDEVTECMCCSSVSFSMFNRRHHCRRCGRVVCGTCSVRRAKVDGYGDLPVRICEDCHNHMNKQRVAGEQPGALLSEFCSSHSSQNTIEWRLLGDETHDRTVREEFAFEHAPSVGLCLSILDLHSEHAAGEPRVLIEAADQMLKLLKPPKDGCINPELDYVLVIRMARSLLMAAKVRYAKMALNSGVAHCDRLLGQVDLLSLLVHSGCGSLLPKNGIPFNDFDLRHLRDSLVAAEMWSLALEVSTKVGLERGGVWAAWGKACLRAGRWMEAREHLAHCLQTSLSAHDPSPAPLLKEVISILEETSYKPESVVMKQTQHLQSPALTVLHTLASLTDTSQGKFPTLPAVNNKTLFNSECQYYLSTYGSHAANLSFFISRSDLISALCYVREKNVESEIFAEALYKPCLRQGLIGQLHEEMRNIDSTLEVWKDTLLHVGRLLEHQGLLQSLYQLQLYAHDLVRAAMTCIRFYHASARCYSELSPEYLHKARSHLENELTMTQWKPGVRERDEQSPPKSPTDSMESSSSGPPEAQLPLRLPARQLNQHVSTICRQLEVTKFLQQCESDGRSVVAVAAELRKEMQSGTVPLIPTLFGSGTVRAFVSALLIVCGKNVEEGFGIAFRVIQEFHLRPLRVYALAAQWLTIKSLVHHLEQLVGCIRSSGSADSASCSDELLMQCVLQLVKQPEGIKNSDVLLRLIMDPPTKIQAHLACGQLKSAYLLAVKLGRSGDVQGVLQEAEKINQPAMIRICKQWLSQQQKKSTS